MAMALKIRFNYRTKLFFIVNVFFWLLVVAFITIQYTREREYKVSILDAQLQVYNDIILKKYQEDRNLSDPMISQILRDDDLRVTIIDHSGNVLFDSYDKDLENHSDRPEFQKALKNGKGHTIRRFSETDKRHYFYSATSGVGVVVRTALPYNLELRNVLKGDMEYIWIVLAITMIINIILYFAINRLSLGVSNLREFARQAKDGDIRNFDTSKLPNDELGEVSVVIINMYKELKEVAEQRDKSLEEALYEEKEKTRIKHQLTSNINHELKTPVQAIRGCFETLLDNNLNEEMRKKLLETGYNNTMRLSNLLQDVTLITRITDEKETLEVSDVNVGDVVSGICKDVDAFSIEKQMRINVKIPGNVVIKGNRQLIDAIFRNLINNAIAYSGGRDIFISMNKETETSYWFDVYDNGTGVEEKHLSRIFERFYRIDSGRSRKSGGTGLGLSIVRNSVLFHGGEIKAFNKKSAGLEFVFSLHK